MIADTTAPIVDVAIVGGGFSGAMVALAIVQATRARILIVERGSTPGRGTAYADEPRDAILNVPAGAMGAFPDRPDDFVRWLRDADETAFLPRRLYGDYLESLVTQARADGHAITSVQADVVDIRRGPAGRTLIDARGHAIVTAPYVVLALGAPKPADLVPNMPAVRDHPAYVADPWRFLGAPAFAATGEILVAGSGLTALDVIAAFARSGATNALRVVSRGGRFPLAHNTSGGRPIAPFPAGRRPDSIREIVSLVRVAVRDAHARGIAWHAVMDGLRPHIADLWIGLDLVERRRFLRHVRSLFDPHRHRAPAALLAHARDLTAQGRLTIEAARFLSVESRDDALVATIAARGTTQPMTLRVAQIINCFGPKNDYSDSGDPLIETLRERGEIRLDPAGLGLCANIDGRLTAANGSSHTDLFAIGWLLRGVFFETTAVRELRVHAAQIGRDIAALCAARIA